LIITLRFEAEIKKGQNECILSSVNSLIITHGRLSARLPIYKEEREMTKTIEVSDETYERIKDQLNENEQIEINSYDDFIGKKWFFRTVSFHLVGKVKKRIGSFLQLETASWVADSGRFMQAIKNGELDEVEPVGIAFVNINSVVDIFPWNHTLPTEQK
jgi:hypothetical protein